MTGTAESGAHLQEARAEQPAVELTNLELADTKGRVLPSGRWAAIDLGSNNFQMLLVDMVDGELRILDRLKDKVQLLQGFRSGNLAAPAVARGLAVLGRYAQLVAGVPPHRVSIKGTYALRVAANRDAFCREAEAILGAPVDVISGAEEARLIDVGVSRHLDPAIRTVADRGRCLVIDIGGGSTELALSCRQGDQRRLVACASLPLGCVSLTEAWLARPELVGGAYQSARAEALRIFRAGSATLSPDGQGRGSIDDFSGVDLVIGTSGILESILTVSEANGFSHGAITRLAVLAVERALTSGLWVADLGLPGLPPERTDIFPAGVAILSAAMEVLRIERLHFSDATLPLGMLYDRLGLGADADPSTRAVAALAARFQLDREHGERVARRAQALLESAVPGIDARHRRLLSQAARLHEIGLSISVQGYHRHGAYLLQHTTLRGFQPDDQQALAWLVRGHRRALPHAIAATGERLRYDRLEALLLALRLAVVLERGRSDAGGVPRAVMRLEGSNVLLEVPGGWLARNALSAHGLQDERVLLARQGYRLGF